MGRVFSNTLPAVVTSCGLLSSARLAHADELVEFEADELETAPPFDEIELSGNVRARRGRFVVRAEQAVVRRDGSGRADGGGDVATCPCEPAPVRFAFSSAEWDSDGEVQMDAPRIELFGVTAAWLPWLWLRPPDRVGLLMPELALRGDDGLLVGSGVHVPVAEGAGVDLRAAGYVEGGAELSATVEAPTSTTRLVWDHIRSTRAVVRSEGHWDGIDDGSDRPRPGLGDGTLSWSADAIRGPRARRGTVDLFEATLPHDHVRVEAASSASDELGAIGGASFRGRSARGRGEAWVGPRADVGVGGPLGRWAQWAASSHSGVLMSDDGALPHAVGRLGGEGTLHAGPMGIRVDSRQRVRAARAASDRSSADAVASAGLTTSLPFVRTFGAESTWVHWLAPELIARGALTAVDGRGGAGFTSAEPGPALAAGGGATTSIGTYGLESLRISVRGGALGNEAWTRPAGHARAAMEAGWLALAWTGGLTRGEFDRWGTEHWIRGRIGDRDGIALRGDTVSRVGRSARGARWFSDLSTLPGEELTDIRQTGWTGGAQLDVPWTASLTSSSRLDGRLDEPRLLALGTALSYQHGCRCLRLGASAAHRLGRDGLDVALVVDLLP